MTKPYRVLSNPVFPVVNVNICFLKMKNLGFFGFAFGIKFVNVITCCLVILLLNY